LRSIASWRVPVLQNLHFVCLTASPQLDIRQYLSSSMETTVVDISNQAFGRLDIEMLVAPASKHKVAALLACSCPFGGCCVVFMPGETDIDLTYQEVVKFDPNAECFKYSSKMKDRNKIDTAISKPVEAQQRRIIISTDILGRSATIVDCVLVVLWSVRKDPFVRFGGIFFYWSL
jgi:hypothetical protein